MAQKIVTAFLLIVSLTISQNLATAQSAQRIQFAKGKSIATVKGTTGSSGVTYVVRASSGQKLVLNLTPTANVGITVEKGADGSQVLLREESGGTYEVGLEESGDVTIVIGSTNNQPVSFTLTVKITKLTDM